MSADRLAALLDERLLEEAREEEWVRRLVTEGRWFEASERLPRLMETKSRVAELRLVSGFPWADSR